MSIAEKIRDFLRSHPNEELFTRGDLLKFGHPIAVDNVIHDLVHKSGEIKRIARGLFSKKERTKPITVLEAATVKNKRFGKTIVSAPEDLAHELGITGEPARGHVFMTNGRTSAFHLNGQRITSKGASPRKMALGDSPPGCVIRALWHIGEQAVTSKIVALATRALTFNQRTELGALAASMPGWLSEFFFPWNDLGSIKKERFAGNSTS